MMKLFKWLFILVIVLALIVAAFIFSKDSIARAAAERQIRAQTGMDVKIGKFSVGLLSPVVTIQDLKLYNTPEFGGTPFMSVREIHAEYDQSALAERKLRIKLLRLDIAELTMVKNDSGKTNFQSLAGFGVLPKPGVTNTIELTGIEVANISAGHFRAIDLKNPSRNREWNIRLRDQVFKNIRTQDDAGKVLEIIWSRAGGTF